MIKKTIIIFLLMLILSEIALYSISPIIVKDKKSLLKKIENWLDEKLGEIKKFETKISELDKHTWEFRYMRLNFTKIWSGFKNDWSGAGGWEAQTNVLVDLKGLEEALSKITNYETDSWEDLIDRISENKISDQYKNIENYDFVRKSSIYKRSTEVQKQVENEIEKNNKTIKKYQYNLNYLKNVITDEKEIGNRIKIFQDKLKKSGQQDKNFTGDFHGILFLNAITRYETMRVRVHLLAMIRLLLEQELIDQINEMDDILRNAREAASTAEANTK